MFPVMQPWSRLSQSIKEYGDSLVATPVVIKLAASTTAAVLYAQHQGLTLVHFSAQRKRCLWDRGCI
jgi:C4-dicarboxylate transporter